MNEARIMFVARQFAAIAINVARKVIRQPLILLTACSCICMDSLLPMVALFNFGDEGKLVRDGVLSFHLLFGLAITIAAASAALHAEIKSGNASTVLCKPVGRPLFLLATYSGIVIVIVMFSLQAMIAGLLSMNISLHWQINWYAVALINGALALAAALAAAANAWMRRPFVSCAFLLLIPVLLAALAAMAWSAPLAHIREVGGCCAMHPEHLASVGNAIQWKTAPAGVLITMALAVFAAIAVAFSTRLPPVFTTTFCVALLLLGLVSDYYLAELSNVSLGAAFWYAILPNWQDFWMADALSGEGYIPWSYVAKAGAYAVLYLSGVLCIALASFFNVELK